MRTSPKLIFFFLALFLITHCDQPTNNQPSKEPVPKENPDKKTTEEGNHFSGVMMQGFYWDVPAGGTWWDTINNKVSVLSNMAGGYGIDRIWLPPASKSQSGPYSMGYDPADYYDLGEYEQHGSIETRFGSKKELTGLISTLHENNISVMADIVMNHRSGGAYEYNPVTGDSTYTDFTNVKSGKMAWTWKTFHPNPEHDADAGYFGGFADVCYVTGTAYNDMETWLNWLKSDIGFDGGWRFDYVKGLDPWVVKDMKIATGDLFSIGEYWDGNVDLLSNWSNKTGASVFDFALYYTMRDIFNKTDGSGYLPNLVDPAKSFAAKNPLKAVTFAGNHDTDEIITDKMMAYAFMLTYQGYPSIWWKDYFNYGLDDLGGKWGNGINQLVWVRGALADGSPEIELLKTNDGDLLIYAANGYSSESPGYIVVINDQPADWKGATVQTANTYLQDKKLTAYAWHSTVPGQNNQPDTEYANASGEVEVYAPPRGYAVYSVEGF